MTGTHGRDVTATDAVGKGLAPNLAIGRLVYRERRWMEEGL